LCNWVELGFLKIFREVFAAKDRNEKTQLTAVEMKLESKIFTE